MLGNLCSASVQRLSGYLVRNQGTRICEGSGEIHGVLVLSIPQYERRGVIDAPPLVLRDGQNENPVDLA